MAKHDPPDYGASDPSAYGTYGYGGEQGGYGRESAPEPTPGWRKPLALTGWGLLIAILIGLIIYGIIELAHGRPAPATVTATVTASTTPPSTTTTTPPTSSTTTTTTTTTTPTTTTSTTEPTTTASTTASTTLTTTTSTTPTTTTTTDVLSPGALPDPSRIMLPQIPTVITLPPGF